jgi:DNA-binding MarR family transcriptional regulator
MSDGFVSDLDGHLGFLLRLAHLDSFARFFSAAILTESQLTEATLLHLLKLNPGIRQGVLARQLRIKRAHMTKIIQGLEGRGLVALSVPPEDRRSVTLQLTPEGAAHLAGLWPAVLDGEARVPAGLTGAEQTRLLALLTKLIATPPRLAQEDAHEP